MAWTAPRTWVTAELVSASLMNTHVRDNELETAPAKVTTAGDIIFATGANAISRLAIGATAGGFLTAGASAPIWTTSTLSLSSNTLSLGDGGGDTYFDVKGSAGDDAGIRLYKGGNRRWEILANDDAEGGSATGSNFAINAFNNAGAILRNSALFIDRESGQVAINKLGSNANMEIGLTINQDQNDDEILALQSVGDVAHGMTGLAETTSFGVATKVAAATGGLRWDGYTQATIGMVLAGNAATEETGGVTSSSLANVMVAASLKSGTNRGVHGANAHLFGIRNFGTTVWLVDTEGDTHRAGTDNTFDAWDDVHLARAFEIEMAPDKVIRTEFDKFLKYGRDDLVKAGILTSEENYYNESQLLRLVTGAVYQIQTKLNMAMQKIETLEQGLLT